MQIDFFNPRSIVCLIAILQGLVFAALLVARGRREKNRADFYLALLLLMLCLSLVTPLIGFANVYDLNQWLTYFPFAVAYSYGVCIWLYVAHLTDAGRRLHRRDWWLFLPPAVYLAVRLALFAQSLEFKDWFYERFDRLFGAFVFVTEFVWNTALLYAAIRHYRKYRVWLDDNYSDTERLKFDWLRNFLYLFSAVFVAGAFFDFVNSFLYRLSYIQYFYFELLLALVTYYLAIAGYLRSQPIEPRFAAAAPGEPAETAPPAAPPDTELEKLKTRLEFLMREEKLFLEPALTLADLAKVSASTPARFRARSIRASASISTTSSTSCASARSNGGSPRAHSSAGRCSRSRSNADSIRKRLSTAPSKNSPASRRKISAPRATSKNVPSPQRGSRSGPRKTRKRRKVSLVSYLSRAASVF